MADDQAAPRGPQDFEKALDKSATEVASFAARDTSALARFHYFLHANPTAAPVVVLMVSCIVFGIVRQ